MRPYVRVAARADDNAIIDKIAEQMVIVHSQLSEQMHTRPNAGDVVSLDATHLGHHNAHLVSCIAESLFVKFQIINDCSAESSDGLLENEQS